ncbi:CSEP0350 putative effector protein [Blumeria hordei DH14]|uniref:CSEP0350 putative effector protein n=1 Tax=Blumeria graminis f. sp. hordei (strain DH14) TaxID=546991 RepID=N1J9S9_BLUG1|nr:CSEP0350 putative effector protein [Blumeria hordei DH14]
MRFLLAFVFMVIGLMAMPTGPEIGRRSNPKTIGTKIMESLDGIRFEDNVDNLVNKTRGSIDNVVDKITTIFTEPVEKVAQSGRKISTFSKLFGPVIGMFSHSSKTKRFLQQDSSSYQIDGKTTFT